MRSRLEWTNEKEFTLDGTSFLAATIRDTPPASDQMVIVKGRRFVEAYERLMDEIRPRRMLELGIFAGGSTAFFAAITDPEKLVAVDISDKQVAILEQWIDEHDLRGRVSTYYGVDQADADALTKILHAEFGDEPLDFVIDDASHLVPETRASFDLVFPYMRPGGTYLVEDWSWAHRGFAFDGPRKHSRFADATPLSAFVFELVLASAYAPSLVSEVNVRQGWATVTRGPDPIEGEWHVSSCLDAVGREMVARLER